MAATPMAWPIWRAVFAIPEAGALLVRGDASRGGAEHGRERGASA
jgi:hypothetical protein